MTLGDLVAIVGDETVVAGLPGHPVSLAWPGTSTHSALSKS